MADAALTLRQGRPFIRQLHARTDIHQLIDTVNLLLNDAEASMHIRREHFCGIVFAANNPLFCLNSSLPAMQLHHRLQLPPACHLVHARDDSSSMAVAVRLLADAAPPLAEHRHILTVSVDATATLTVALLDAPGKAGARMSSPTLSSI